MTNHNTVLTPKHFNRAHMVFVFDKPVKGDIDLGLVSITEKKSGRSFIVDISSHQIEENMISATFGAHFSGESFEDFKEFCNESGNKSNFDLTIGDLIGHGKDTDIHVEFFAEYNSEICELVTASLILDTGIHGFFFNAVQENAPEPLGLDTFKTARVKLSAKAVDAIHKQFHDSTVKLTSKSDDQLMLDIGEIRDLLSEYAGFEHHGIDISLLDENLEGKTTYEALLDHNVSFLEIHC